MRKLFASLVVAAIPLTWSDWGARTFTDPRYIPMTLWTWIGFLLPAYGAWLLAVAVPWLWIEAGRAGLMERARLLAHLLPAAAALQIALGIATLLHAVPVALAATHQAGALVVFTFALALNHALREADATRPAARAVALP